MGTKTLSKPFAASQTKPTRQCARVGRHMRASRRMKEKSNPKEKPICVPKNKHNQKHGPRANVITRYLDKNMQTKLEKKKEVYYKDSKGIQLTYPVNSEQVNLLSLKIVDDNKSCNKFNVFIGCERGNESKATFVVLKVSKKKKVIDPEKMKRYNEALEGMLKNKPSVVRGKLRKGISPKYVCHGYRKNPLNKKIGEYAYKRGVDAATKRRITKMMNALVGDIERRAIEEMKSANLHNCTGCNDFVKAQEEFGITSMSDKGHATQVALTQLYCSPAHTDPDFFFTTLAVHDEKAKPDEVLYHFCFPTYGIAVPMTKGDIIMFNPLVEHCATNPRTETALIYSAYVSSKTCNTIVARMMVNKYFHK